MPGQVIPEVQDLQEVEMMLAETVAEQWKRGGLQQGLPKPCSIGPSALLQPLKPLKAICEHMPRSIG